MLVKEIILTCYILCIAGLVAGLTCGVLSQIYRKIQLNKAAVVFLIGMLAICFYDMAIYYCNYVIGILSCMEVMRVGNCLIAVTMFLWLGFQKQIIDRNAISFLDGIVRRYMLIYAAVWFVLTVVMPVDYFYTFISVVFLKSVIGLICGMVFAPFFIHNYSKIIYKSQGLYSFLCNSILLYLF